MFQSLDFILFNLLEFWTGLFIYQSHGLSAKVPSVMTLLGGLQLVSQLYIYEANPNK